MKAIVYCEGSTERDFVNRVLGPYLSKRGVHVCPVVCTTSNRGGIAHKGGVSTYGMISKELKRLCGRTDAYVVTTMFDLYGFPPDVPNCKDPKDVSALEEAISEDISNRKFVPYISKHEFEALLFSDVTAFESSYPEAVQKLMKIRKEYSSPEDINNSPSTAPSKRILGQIPAFKKTTDGITISGIIGIDEMIRQCPHFRQWIGAIIKKAALEGSFLTDSDQSDGS